MASPVRFQVPTQSANLGFKASDAAWPNLHAPHPVDKQFSSTSLLPGGSSYSALLATPLTHLQPTGLGRAPSGESESVRNAKLHLSPESIQKLAGPNRGADGLPIDRSADWKPHWGNAFIPAPIDPVAHTYGFAKQVVDSTKDFAQHLSNTYWTMKNDGGLKHIPPGVLGLPATAAAVINKALAEPMRNSALAAAQDPIGAATKAATTASEFSHNYLAALTNPQHTSESSVALGAQTALVMMSIRDFFKPKPTEGGATGPGSKQPPSQPPRQRTLDEVLAQSRTITNHDVAKGIRTETKPNQRTGEPTSIYVFEPLNNTVHTHLPAHGFRAMYSDKGAHYPDVQLVLEMPVAPVPDAKRTLGDEFLMTQALLEKLKADGKNPNRVAYFPDQQALDAAKVTCSPPAVPG